jgi:hypothetical protein
MLKQGLVVLLKFFLCSKAKIAPNHHNKPFIFAFLTLKSYICARNEKREKNIYPFVAAGDGL